MRCGAPCVDKVLLIQYFTLETSVRVVARLLKLAFCIFDLSAIAAFVSFSASTGFSLCVMPPRTWDTKTLVYAEAAVQTHLIRSRKREKLLPLKDFYQIVQSIPFLPLENDAKFMESKANDEIFSREESVLLDLLCSSSPILYRLSNINADWHLEVLPFSGNRVEKLRQLASKRCASSFNGQNDFENILREQKLKQKKSEQQKPITADSEEQGGTTSSSVLGKGITLDGSVSIDKSMTLEQRVIARSQAKKSLQDLKKNAEKTIDNSLLRLADALWAHSRHVRQRRSRVLKTSADSKNLNSPCIMTLKEIVSNFSTSMFTTTRATHKEVVGAVVELHRRAPEWIVLSSVKDMTSLRKNTTVRIHHIDNYQKVRVQLGGDSRRKATTPSLIGTSPLLPRKIDPVYKEAEEISSEENSSNFENEPAKSFSEISMMILKRTTKHVLGKEG